MSNSREEVTYSTIFTSLKHPIRRKILRMLHESPKSFSEMQETFRIESSHLTYHLENLKELIYKTDNGRYKLSTFGEAAVTTMSMVEEAPKVTETKRPSSLSIKWKSFFVVLTIGLVVLASVSYIQYQSLDRVSTDYEELKDLVDLVEKGASLQSEYTLRYEVEGFEFDEESLIEGSMIKLKGPSHCVIYFPNDNFTLYLVLTINTILYESYVPINVQEGNVFDLRTNETAPVIWSLNATASGIYSVPLVSKGWYTISLFGPIKSINPLTFSFRIPVEDIDCWMSLRIIYEGKYAPFLVTTNRAR